MAILWCAVAIHVGAATNTNGTANRAKGALEFRELVFDCGLFPPNEPVRFGHDYAFTNRGTRPVRILHVENACRTAASCPVDVVRPGESSFIHVVTTLPPEYTNTPEVRRQINVGTDDPDRPSIDLLIRAHFSRTFSVEPEEVAFGVVGEGERVERVMELKSVTTGPLEIKGFAFDRALYSVEELPSVVDAVSSLPVLRFRCVTTASLPSGAFADTLRVFTNRSDAATIRIPVWGESTPAIHLEPEEVFLGVVRSGVEARKDARIMGPASVDIREVTTTIPGLQATVEKDGAERVLRLLYRSEGFCGAIDGMVRMRTSSATKPEITLRVTGLVRKRSR